MEEILQTCLSRDPEMGVVNISSLVVGCAVPCTFTFVHVSESLSWFP